MKKKQTYTLSQEAIDHLKEVNKKTGIKKSTLIERLILENKTKAENEKTN